MRNTGSCNGWPGLTQAFFQISVGVSLSVSKNVKVLCPFGLIQWGILGRFLLYQAEE